MAEKIIAVIEHDGVPAPPPTSVRETLKPSGTSTYQPEAALVAKYAETLNPASSPLVENPDEGEPIGLWIDNRFELRELVGKGSMCKVFKAFDHELKRIVAAKVLHEQFRADHETDIISRFRSEGELVASLSHPDIVQVYHTTQDPKLGIVMILELVEGPSLRELLKEKTLTARAAAEITLRLARAMEYAHHGRMGPDGKPVPPVIHRDLKPANILIAGPVSLLNNPSDFRLHVKVTDFGLGKVIKSDSSHGNLTMHGMVIGTPSYMSPEQAGGEQDLTIAVDVYGLGATLYEMLTGKPPFSGPTVSLVLRQVQEDDPISPTYLVPKIPKLLSAICLKCLEKNPSNRYATARELASDLERWLNNKPTIARVPNWIQVFAKWSAKHPARALAGGTITLLSAGILVLGFYSSQQSTKHQYMQANQELLIKQRQQLNLLQNKSLATLNGILDLLTEDGPMRNLTGLEPLHYKLNQFYQNLIMEDAKGVDVLDPRELGKAHLRLIRLISQKGNKSDAISVIQHGIALYEKVFQRNGSVATDLFALGQIHLSAAEIFQDLGRYEEGLAHLDKAASLFQEVEANGSSSELKSQAGREFGRTLNRRGLIHSMQPGQQNEAKANFSQAIAKFKEMLAEKQSNADRQNLEKLLANSYSNLGDVYLGMKNYFLADENYWAAFRYRVNGVRELAGLNPEEIVEGHARWQLAAPSPENLEALFRMGTSYSDFGELHFQLGIYSTAHDLWSKTLKIQNRVVAISPNITEYKAELGHAINRLSEAALLRILQKGSQDESGDLQKIERDLDRSIGDFLQPLHRDEPESLSIRRSYATSRYLRGVAAWMKKEPKVAEKHMDKAWEVFAKVVLQPNCRAADYYLMAKIFALKATLAEGDATAFHVLAGQACKHLNSAVKTGYLGKTEAEIRADFAFAPLVNLPEFNAALQP